MEVYVVTLKLPHQCACIYHYKFDKFVIIYVYLDGLLNTFSRFVRCYTIGVVIQNESM